MLFCSSRRQRVGSLFRRIVEEGLIVLFRFACTVSSFDSNLCLVFASLMVLQLGWSCTKGYVCRACVLLSPPLGVEENCKSSSIVGCKAGAWCHGFVGLVNIHITIGSWLGVVQVPFWEAICIVAAE